MKVAETNAWVFVKVITSSVVPPALIVDGVKVLETIGRLGVMLSISAAVQVPAMHPKPVFVTPTGTEIVAVLVTCDWANAGECSPARKANTHRPSTSWLVEYSLNREAFRRLSTFCLQNPKDAVRFVVTVYLKLLEFSELNT